MPKPKRIKKTISMSEDTAERLRSLADARHTTISQLITNWVWMANVTPKYTVPADGWSKTQTPKQDDDEFH